MMIRQQGSDIGFICGFFNFAVLGLDIPFDEFQGVISFGSCLIYIFTPGKVN